MLDVLLRLTGTRPLVMHNVRLANPLDPYAKAHKELSGIRKKTDEIYAEMARVEYLGGLYEDSTLGPYVPGEWVFASLVQGARLNALGKKVERGLLLGDTGDVNPLVYKGTRDKDKLALDPNFGLLKAVRVGQSRVMRTRPCFRGWSCEIPLFLDQDVLNFEDLVSIADRAGRYIGIGDHRPMYGRFTAETLKT